MSDSDFETMPVGTAALLVEAMMKLSSHAGTFKEQAAQLDETRGPGVSSVKRWREERAQESWDLASRIEQLIGRSHAADRTVEVVERSEGMS